MTRPKSATAHWLKKLGAEPVDISPPRSGGIDGVEVVARVQKDNFEKVLRGSGEFGVFSRPFFVKGDARVYKDAPLPVEFDLQAGSSEESEGGRPFHPRGCHAVKGSRIAYEGVRLREFRWPDLLRGGSQEVYRGKMEATNLPLSWSKAAVQTFLPSFGQRCRSPPQTAARFWVFAYPARGTTQTSTSAGHCGQNREKLQWKVKRLQNIGRVWSEETPRHQ